MPEAPVGRIGFLRSAAERSEQLALLAFVLVTAVALGLFLVFGHGQTFFFDEWDFLAHRDGGDLGDLLRPHNEHWSTLPILVYRGFYRLFGLRTYVPYQVASILLHLTAAALLLVVMRRAGVRPWIATAAASLFALFGAGNASILWAFQMALSASLVLGLTHLLLADHGGPLDRRDWLGLLAGFAGLLCSGVAVTMTIVVGLAVLFRRGWRVAFFHTAPLGAVYVIWWAADARDAYTRPVGAPGEVARFVTTGIGATFDAMGQAPGAGIALGVLLLVGSGLAWHALDHVELRQRAVVPAAMLVGAVVFFVITGIGRVNRFRGEWVITDWYLHIAAALSLPAVAVAANAVAQRWRLLAPAVMMLLLIGIAGNVHLIADYEHLTEPPPVSSLLQSNQRIGAEDCQTIGRAVEHQLDKDDSLRIDGGKVRIFALGGAAYVQALVGEKLVFDPNDGHTITALRGPVGFRLVPVDATKPVVLCRDISRQSTMTTAFQVR
jgi:hypothetical protein